MWKRHLSTLPHLYSWYISSVTLWIKCILDQVYFQTTPAVYYWDLDKNTPCGKFPPWQSTITIYLGCTPSYFISHIAHLFPFKPAFIVFNPCIDWGSKNSIFAHFTLISCYDTGKNQWFKNCWVVSLSHKHVCISFSICTVLSTVERLWVFALSYFAIAE